jgi:hypothetical protein
MELGEYVIPTVYLIIISGLTFILSLILYMLWQPDNTRIFKPKETSVLKYYGYTFKVTLLESSECQIKLYFTGSGKDYSNSGSYLTLPLDKNHRFRSKPEPRNGYPRFIFRGRRMGELTKIKVKFADYDE